jgi:hypothetical protein
MAAAPITGTLTVTVVKGLDLNDVQTIGAMSPYGKLSVGKEAFSTKPHEKGGKTPTWNQAFIFNLDGKEVALHVVLLNKGTLSDGTIGRVDVPLSNLIKASAETAFDLVHPDNFKKSAGKIVLKTEYKNPNAPAPQAAAAQPAAAPKVVVMAQPQMVYQQPQVVYAQPGMGGQQVVYAQQPQVVYMAAQPGQQVMYAQPGQQVVYMQPRTH